MTATTPVAPPPYIARTVDLGLLVLRVVAGLIFVVHGWQKVFVMGLPKVAAFFGSLGVPLAQVFGPAVAFLEIGGGLALIIGLFARQVGVIMTVVMLVAATLQHLPHGFLLPQGYEFVLLLAAAAAAVALAGPGRYSVDAARLGRVAVR